MGKRKKLEPSVPSKAYLVSFGDTMTALLAFFIVLNSLAKEQTGAAMYSGTGSFVSSFTNSGMPGALPGKRSRDMLQQEAQKPIYALSENMDKNDGQVGPDNSDSHDRIRDREKNEYQKFLQALEDEYGVKQHAPLTDQIVFDSFERFDKRTGEMSRHALELISEALNRVRTTNSKIEIIAWADMPSPGSMRRHLDKTMAMRREVKAKFWIDEKSESRISFRVKPWLFSDAKRPVVSIVLSSIDGTDPAAR